MKTSDSQSTLIPALFAAKKAFPRIEKNKRGQAGNRSFNYAPLDAIMDHVDPVLHAHGLMITQGTQGHELVTRLEHTSGEWRETTMPVNAEHANMQSYGIELTYRRRYAYQLILGIVTEEDIDIKEKRGRESGKDFTGETNPPPPGSGAAVKADAFSSQQPEVQDALRKVAAHVVAAMPDAVKAKDILVMGLEEWPDEDRNELKVALWHLLDAKTRSAIKRVDEER